MGRHWQEPTEIELQSRNQSLMPFIANHLKSRGIYRFIAKAGQMASIDSSGAAKEMNNMLPKYSTPMET